MRNSVVLASLLFLFLLVTRVHGMRRLEMHHIHAALNNKEDARDPNKWQQPSDNHQMVMRHASNDGRGGLGGGPAEEDVHEMEMKSNRTVAPKVHDEDYVGPSGHSPNHHRTNPCGPCN